MSYTSKVKKKFPPWSAIPAFGWLFFFLIAPFTLIGIYGFLTKGPYGEIVPTFTLENYARAFDYLYLKILWSSLKLAILTTLSCLVLGYPMAYVLARATPQWRSVLLLLVIIPFWTNFVVRAYAVKVLLGPYAQSYFAVWMGMVTNYLPFMVLPLYVSLEKVDFSLLDAAKDLGANPPNQLWRVLLPLTKQGIFTGSILVFAPAIGEFVIPDIFGGAKTMLLGNLITEQFLKSRDWPFGSALSILLLVSVLSLILIYSRSMKREKN